MTPQEQIDRLQKFFLETYRDTLLDCIITPLKNGDVIDFAIKIIQEQDKKLKNIRRLAKRAR